MEIQGTCSDQSRRAHISVHFKMYDNFHAAAVPRKDLTSRKSKDCKKLKKPKKPKKPNGIETVKEKHHTGLQEYENQEKICKVYKIKFETFSNRTFQPPIQLRWVIFCGMSTESKFHPGRGFLYRFTILCAAKLRVKKTIFQPKPLATSRFIASVHTEPSPAQVKVLSTRTLRSILEISLSLVE